MGVSTFFVSVASPSPFRSLSNFCDMDDDLVSSDEGILGVSDIFASSVVGAGTSLVVYADSALSFFNKSPSFFEILSSVTLGLLSEGA